MDKGKCNRILRYLTESLAGHELTFEEGRFIATRIAQEIFLRMRRPDPVREPFTPESLIGRTVEVTIVKDANVSPD